MRSLSLLSALVLATAAVSSAQVAAPDVSHWALSEYPPAFFQGRTAAGQEALEFWMQSLNFRENIGRDQQGRTLFENLASTNPAAVAAGNKEITRGCRHALADIPAFRKKNARTIHLWIVCLLRVPAGFTPETRALLEQTLRELDVAHPDNDFADWIEIAGANGSNVHGHLTPLLLAPEITGDEKARRLGYWGMRRELDHQNTTGDVGEYNLLEGHFNGITDWEIIRQQVHDLHLRRIASMIEERLWINRYLTWSAAVERNTGPGSRMAPHQWLGSDNERFLFATTTQKPIWLNLFFPWDGDGALKFHSTWPLNQAQATLPQLPEYLQDLAWKKAYPHELQAALTYLAAGSSPKLPGVAERDPLDPKKYVNYQTAGYTLGSVTGSWVVTSSYVAAAAFWNNSRNPKAPLGSPERFCVLYPHYVMNGMSFLDQADLFFENSPKPLGDNRGGPRGPWLRDFLEFGRLGTLQHRNTLLASYSPDPGTSHDRLTKSKLQRASAGMFLMRWTEGTDGLFINRKPVTSLPAELAPGDWWFIEDGDVYAAVRPLTAAHLRGPCRTVLEQRNRHIVLYQDNYAGDSIEGISDQEWVQARSGFVVEMGDRAEYGSFAKFQDLILASQVTKDTADGFQRAVAYQRAGRSLEMNWHCYNESFAQRQIDGHDDPWPSFLTSPEFSLSESGAVQVRDATLATTPGKSVWLLSSAPSHTWVAYQPHPEETLPLTFTSPAATITAANFPFGKLIVRQPDEHTLACEIDATFRPFFNQIARAVNAQARGTLPSVILIKTGATDITATLNGRPCPVNKQADGLFSINPYHDPKAIREDAGL